MKGEAKQFLKFVDGSDKRFIIPVYQRNYNWEIKQCEQLFNDLKSLINEPDKPHFFGSIVSSKMEHGRREDYLIIDGQQRLTTISLLLVAMVNLLRNNIVQVKDETLCRKINNRHLVDEYNTDERKVRLKPIKEDCQAFDALFGDESDFILTSNITVNYQFFYDRILKEEIDLEKLYDAIERLEIIDIFLEKEDNPQLIFESLNSTGLALEEGDKIRNYILMSLTSDKQEEFYEKYWYKIEKNTEFDNYYYVSDFIKCYLTLKLARTVVIRDIYFSFKEHARDRDREELLKDLLHYSNLYQKLIKPDASIQAIKRSIIRLNQLDYTVIYPFLMAFLHRHGSGELSEQQTNDVLLLIETYIFRRLIVGLPSNTLNKVFATLDRDILKYQKNGEDYVEICKFILLNKEQGARLPDDEEFLEELTGRNIYAFSSKNKHYLFSRLENGNSKEQINVIERIQNGDYTIEHIMPQSLNTQWKKDLGTDCQRIHSKWLNTLANLTLTAYNSNYSNRPFSDKLNIENGFKESNLRLNKFISECNVWTETQLEQRKTLLEQEALKLWPYPKINYKAPEQTSTAYSLDDDIDYKGINIHSYEFLGKENIVANWKEMFCDVVLTLKDLYPAKIRQLALDDDFLSTEKISNSYAELDEYFLYCNTSTASKISGLKYFFEHCGVEFEAITFNIKQNTDNGQQNTEESLSEN